jgi:hypothetical protein
MTAPLLLLVAMLGASPELEDGRVAFARLKYAQAIERLRPLTEKAGAPVEERVEAFELIARASLALNKKAQAVAAFEGLLQLEPMAGEPEGSPKVRQAFDEAKKARFPPGYVELRRRPSGDDVLELDVVNPWRTALTLELWQATTADFTRRELPVTQNRALTALPPGSRSYLRAVAADGRTLAVLAGAAAPIEGPPAPPVAAPVVATAETRPADAPRAEPTADLAPPASPSPLSPQPVPPVGMSTRRLTGWVLLGVGLVSMAAGGALLAWGEADLATARGYPLTIQDPFQVAALLSSGQSKQTAGGITLGIGGALTITGTVLLILGD